MDKYRFYLNTLMLVFLTLTQQNIFGILPGKPDLNIRFLVPSEEQDNGISIPELYNQIKKDGNIPETKLISVSTNKAYPTWGLKNGLPAKLSSPIFIHSAPRNDVWGRFWGAQRGQGLRCVHPWIKHSIINTTVVTFDYLYDAQHFDFGQGSNVDYLNAVYSQLMHQNPKSPLVIAGTCVGAKVALEFTATHNADHLKAMILESPYIDAQKLISNLKKSYVNWIPLHFQPFFSWYFPKSKKAFNDAPAHLRSISPHLPIFIVHLHNDTHYSDKDMYELIDELRQNGNKDIYALVINDPTMKHGHLNNKPAFIKAVNAFLAKYDLPHDAELSIQGEELLAIAHENSFKHHNQWKLV